MDETSIQKHVQSWQQVLAFIARTQAVAAQQAGEDGYHHREWLGKLPVYGMTPRQRRKWRVLWQLAVPALVERRPSPNARARVRVRAGVRVVHTFAGAGQIIEDVWDASPSASASPMEVAEGDTAADATDATDTTDAADAVDAEVEAWQMPAIEQASLEFCVELLNQRLTLFWAIPSPYIHAK
jgi:hypothetical protein